MNPFCSWNNQTSPPKNIYKQKGVSGPRRWTKGQTELAIKPFVRRPSIPPCPPGRPPVPGQLSGQTAHPVMQMNVLSCMHLPRPRLPSGPSFGAGAAAHQLLPRRPLCLLDLPAPVAFLHAHSVSTADYLPSSRFFRPSHRSRRRFTVETALQSQTQVDLSP